MPRLRRSAWLLALSAGCAPAPRGVDAAPAEIVVVDLGPLPSAARADASAAAPPSATPTDDDEPGPTLRELDPPPARRRASPKP